MSVGTFSRSLGPRACLLPESCQFSDLPGGGPLGSTPPRRTQLASPGRLLETVSQGVRTLNQLFSWYPLIYRFEGAYTNHITLTLHFCQKASRCSHPTSPGWAGRLWAGLRLPALAGLGARPLSCPGQMCR